MSVRPQWPDVLDPSFRKIYGDEFKQVQQMAPTIFNVDTSSKNIEKDSSASGLSKLVRRSEGQPISYEDEIQGFDVTYTHYEDSLGTTVSNVMWEDDQFSVMKKKPRNLARAEARTAETIGADIFNHGFTAGGGGLSPFTSGDAQALLSNSHPREDGGDSQSNLTTADLSEDALEHACLAIQQTLDHKGQLFMAQADTLVIPPALEKEAMILLNSSQRVGTANNDINPYQGKLKVVVWKFLGSVAGGSDTSWFVLDSSLHQLNWFNRSNRGVEGPDWDFDTKTARWSVSRRYSAGFSSWRGVFGSKGDNS